VLAIVIGEGAFYRCTSLKHVVFNKNLKTIGWGAFDCSTLKSVALPDNLTVIERGAFCNCTSLERVICNKKLITIGDCAFQNYSKLEDVQLAYSSIFFCEEDDQPFIACNRLIKLAAAAGFPSNEYDEHGGTGEDANLGAGVVPYLIDRFERRERRGIILLANLRFSAAVHAAEGSEDEKFEMAKNNYTGTLLTSTNTTPSVLVCDFLQCVLVGGGAKGVLSSILSFL